jgi:hypothetical protein
MALRNARFRTELREPERLSVFSAIARAELP